MTLDSRQASISLHDLNELHQGVVVELSRPDRHDPDAGRGAPAATRPSVTEAQVRADVDRAMQAIKNAGFSLGALSEKSRSYEDTIRDLKKTLAEMKASHDAANQKSLKAETRARQETERAQQAEARNRAYEAQIKQMELREKTIMGNLERVMRLVDATFGASERPAEQRAHLG